MRSRSLRLLSPCAIVSSGHHKYTIITYSSSTKYGGAPNEVLRPTFTEGTALAPNARPKARAVLKATLEAIIGVLLPELLGRITCDVERRCMVSIR